MTNHNQRSNIRTSKIEPLLDYLGRLRLIKDVSIKGRFHHVKSVTVDGSKATEGSTYIAIRGSKVDGHRFLSQAVDKGAQLVIVEDRKYLEGLQNISWIEVFNSRLVWSHIEAFLHGHPEKKINLIGVTGTNGKSTTTALIGHILKTDDTPVQVGGNLGRPALDLDLLESNGHYVLELSSFQLELTPSGGFDIAVLLNITPDHLDRHGSMAGYIAAKRMIFENCSGTAIVGVDDPECTAICAGLRDRGVANVIPVSGTTPVIGGVYVTDGILIDDIDGGRTDGRIAKTELRLRLTQHEQCMERIRCQVNGQQVDLLSARKIHNALGEEWLVVDDVPLRQGENTVLVVLEGFVLPKGYQQQGPGLSGSWPTVHQCELLVVCQQD